MHVVDLFAKQPTTFSFEFFPPKTSNGADSLFETIRRLEPLNPAFVSVTYGAGGSTRDLTHDLVVRIKGTTSLSPIPHLTCVCHAEADISQILERYAVAGVENILALGGDPPRGMSAYDSSKDAFAHAADLVRFIRKFGGYNSRGFGIGVAGFPEGHPTTPNRMVEMDYLKAKVDAGADYICTQLFFDNHDFLDFCERCELAGITIPIIAGVMPITTLAGMQRMSELALGARIPGKLQRRLYAVKDDPSAVERVGIEWAAEQCRDLLANKVRGIHFYTLNKSGATLEIYKSLGLDSQASR